MSNVAVFQKISGETLDQRALRACKIIVEDGLAVRGGKIVNGQNPEQANAAAIAFSRKDLKHFTVHSSSLKNQAMAGLIKARQQFAETNVPEYLEIMALHATSLRLYGGLQEARLDMAEQELSSMMEKSPYMTGNIVTSFVSAMRPNITDAVYKCEMASAAKLRR